jgi:hypothetical protein
MIWQEFTNKHRGLHWRLYVGGPHSEKWVAQVFRVLCGFESRIWKGSHWSSIGRHHDLEAAKS